MSVICARHSPSLFGPFFLNLTFICKLFSPIYSSLSQQEAQTLAMGGDLASSPAEGYLPCRYRHSSQALTLCGSVIIA